MPLIVDPRYTRGSSVVGSTRPLPAPAPEPLRPSLGDTLAAAARQTLPGAAYERFIANPDPDLPDGGEAFDPFDHIDGFEQEADLFVGADSPSEVEGIKRRLRTEAEDRDVLARSGLGGILGTVGLQLADPSFLAAIAVPQLAIAKSVRMARAVQGAAEGAAGAVAYEAGMQGLQESRTAQESAFSIGSGALLGGVLGAIVGRVPRSEREALQSMLGEEFRSEVGAAVAARPTTLEAESLAPGVNFANRLAVATPFVGTDLARLMTSESLQGRLAVQELADVSPLLRKNLEDVATPASIENAVIRREGAVATFAHTLRAQYKAYAQRVPRAERIRRRDFEALVATAARHDGVAVIPEVQAAAQALRRQVFDPLKEEAQRLGLLPQDVQVVGASSYFRRMYDRDMIRRHRREWDRILTEYFYSMNPVLPEARAAAEDVTRKILGGDVGQANFAVRASIPDAGPLQERVLAIDDAQIERFLINDPVKVAAAYVRELAPQIEITKRFGDKEASDLLQRVRDEYAAKRERVRVSDRTDEASSELTRLEKEERSVLETLTRIRDRIYGRAGRLTPESSQGVRRAVQAARDWRNLVASGRMGGTAVTAGIQDLHRIVATYGFQPTMTKLAQLVAHPSFRSLSSANARRLGAASEVALSRRVHAAADGAITEGWSQTLAEGVFKYSGLNHLTDFYRTLAATLFEDRVLQSAAAVAAGRALPKFEAARLASLGLESDALRAIHREVLEHGGEVDGIRVSGSADWRDAALADRYDAAVLKESRIQVNEPGQADRAWWQDSELGRVLGQLKSFAMAVPLKLTATPLQMVGNRQYFAAARFVGVMMVGGYLSHAARQLNAGKMPTTDPAAMAGEAFVESGLGGVLPDLLAPVGRRLGLAESARYSDSNVLGGLLGPAFGTAQDAIQWLFVNSDNGVSAGDVQLARRLMPAQNVWWLRRAINAIQGEFVEAMELPGYDVASFGERFTRTEALLPVEERGITGTGTVRQ